MEWVQMKDILPVDRSANGRETGRRLGACVRSCGLVGLIGREQCKSIAVISQLTMATTRHDFSNVVRYIVGFFFIVPVS